MEHKRGRTRAEDGEDRVDDEYDSIEDESWPYTMSPAALAEAIAEQETAEFEGG